VSDTGIATRIPIAILVNIALGSSTARTFHRYTMSLMMTGENLAWSSFGKINHDPRRPPTPHEGRDHPAFAGADAGQCAEDNKTTGRDKGIEK